MMRKLSKIMIILCLSSFASACSKGGGIYNSKDPQNNDFSVINTLLIGVAVVGAVAIIEDCRQHKCARGGGGGYYEDPEWDYIQATGEWVCRNAVNGQFMEIDRCYGKAMVDNWPNT